MFDKMRTVAATVRILLRPLSNELSTTPNYVDGELVFRVTHPFHPLFGQQFPLLSQRYTWGDPRVLFHDPTTGRMRSIPIAWTDLAPPDAFVQLAAGRAILRPTDLQELVRLFCALQDALQNGA